MQNLPQYFSTRETKTATGPRPRLNSNIAEGISRTSRFAKLMERNGGQRMQGGQQPSRGIAYTMSSFDEMPVWNEQVDGIGSGSLNAMASYTDVNQDVALVFQKSAMTGLNMVAVTSPLDRMNRSGFATSSKGFTLLRRADTSNAARTKPIKP